MSDRTEYLIVGGGMASAFAAEGIREHDTEGVVTIVGAEPYPPYHRPPLTKRYLTDGDWTPPDTFERPETWYAEHGVEIRMGVCVDSLDLDARSAALSTGETIAFGKLLLATGSELIRLPVPGAGLAGLHYVRGIADTKALLEDLGDATRAVVVGGGFVGAELAASFRILGLDVTLVFRESRLWERLLTPDRSDWLERVFRSKGIELLPGAEVSAFRGGGRAGGRDSQRVDRLEEQRPMATDRERFLACMDYEPSDRRPNHELGVWGQTRARWQAEAPEAVADFTWGWFDGEPALGMDRREFIGVHYGFIPPCEPEVIEETDDYVVARNGKGIVTRALKAGTVGGTRASMDQYLEWPVSTPEDFAEVKKRLIAVAEERQPADLDARIDGWRRRDHVLVLGTNCAANGFYWRAREWMGTEALSFAWYDQPKLMHEMMEFYADFIIETSRPVLERIEVDYFCLNEDMSMKGGPLLGPATYREFIFPHLRRMVDFFRSHGTRHFAVDTDGDPTPLIPLLMDAGVDILWPIERASNVSPQGWRKQFGRELRLWGGVDKRVLPRGPEAIKAHLREFIPLIEEGGFIPTIDHTVPPDVSWDDFRHYMDAKHALLEGNAGVLS